MQKATLHFINGRLAAGKTTLARILAAEHHAVLLSEDFWLAKLADEITTFEDYLKWSRRCRTVMGPLIVSILSAGTSVVLDFSGNTEAERRWVKNLAEEAHSDHLLHILDVSEEECLRRLLIRNETQPDGLYFANTSETDFKAICKWFQEPQAGEGLNLITHSY